MNKLALVLAAAASVTLAGCAPQAEAPVAETVRPVKTVTASLSPAQENLSYTGEVLPRTQTGLGFKMGGRLTERLVEVGDTVAPGDVIARLDRSDIENQVRSSVADRASALAARDTARAALDRQQALFGSGIVTRSQLEAAQLQFDNADARLTGSEAALAIAEDNLDQAELRATTAGVVTQIKANVGQVVAAGEPIAVVADRQKRDAAFDVPERLVGPDISQAGVSVSLLSDPSVSFLSRVREVTPIADPTTRTYRVLVDLTGAPEEMILGAAITGTIDLGSADVFRLPASAITSAEGKPAVYVVDPTSHDLLLKPVVVAQQTSSLLLVGSGLAEGDLVVTAGVSKLRPGQNVRLEEGRP